MGKSYNRNQDKYNKWDKARRERDHKSNHGKKARMPHNGSNHVNIDVEIDEVIYDGENNQT
jgi:hypothetical protein